MTRLGVVTGSRAEARCVPRAMVVCSGGDPARAADGARALIADGANVLVSFGVAAGLAPDLGPGIVVQATEVIMPGGARVACGVGLEIPGARAGAVAGVDVPLSGAADKTALHARTGALVADMESHAVAAAAHGVGMPCIVVRAVADPVDRRVPPWTLVGLGPDGRLRPLAVLNGLVRRPGDLPALLRLARDSAVALKALGVAAQAL